MIKLDIINEVVHKMGMPRAQAELAIDAVFNRIKKALSEGDRIELRGFGVLSVRPRKTGIGRNPRTGVEIPLAPGRVVRFRPGKTLKDL